VAVPIEIEATKEQLEEWPQRDGSPEPDLLERLLGTIRGTARRPRKPQPPGSKGFNTPVLAADDRYVIPLEQRLVLLARYRHQVAAVVRAYWFAEPSRLSNLLSDDELPRALALFGLQDDGSELLSSLGPAADALDQRRAGQ
jgi:hypothetical protein